MSGPKHQHQPKPKAEQSQAPLGGKVFDEHKPPAAKKVVECVKCFYGQDTSRGYRICRGSPPTPRYMPGTVRVEGLWPEVLDSDYCSLGTPL